MPLQETASRQILQVLAGLIDAWNDHDLERIVACYKADCEGVDVALALPQYGRDAVQRTAARYLDAFPDLQFVVKDSVVDQNRAVQTWMASGTHQGTLLNIPPTGRPVTICGTSLYVVEDGQIRRAEHCWDLAGFLRAIGLLPEL